MNRITFAAVAGSLLGGASLFASLPTAAEDIDIFVGGGSAGFGKPNILIVLDNTANWSRQSQQWPGGSTQGQSEVNAIKRMIQGLDTSVNVGLMEFVTGGTANDNGGFMRFNISPMSSENKLSFGQKLSTIYNNITSPDEKRNSNTPYGNLMYDVFNYYAGANSYSPSGVLPAPIADPNGYATPYSRFKSPLSLSNSCGNNYVIFIGNPNHNGPASDSSANTTALGNLGGDTTQLKLPQVTTQTTTSDVVLGNTAQCYSDRASAETAYGYGWNSDDNLCQLYSAIGSLSGSATDRASVTCKKFTNTGNAVATANEYRSQCSAFTQGCKLGSVIPTPTTTEVTSSLTGYLASAPAATAADAGAKAGLACPSNASSCSYTVVAADTAPAYGVQTASTNSCYYTGSGQNPGNLPVWSDPLANGTHDYGTLSCPADYTCTYTKVGNDQDATCQGASGNVKKAVIRQTATPKTRYTVTRTATIVGGTCPANTNQYQVVGANTVYVNGVTSNTMVDSGPRNADEWARFLFKKGVPVPDSSIKSSVVTYTIDVYNKQPNAEQSSLLMSMAREGGGKYFAAKNEDAILTALQTIMVEIQAVNTTFASTSLPVNATNRTQNENQVFIGMFRPDSGARPRWFGNLKRYQLINNGGVIELGDATEPIPKIAVNSQTGFLAECAASYWTTESANYWERVTDGTLPVGQLLDPKTVMGQCPDRDPYSDAPDGPLVEKGAVAQVLRQGNSPTVTSKAPTWAVNRSLYTQTGDSLTAFDTTSSGLSSNLVNFISGYDVNNEKANNAVAETRPSIHGDVIHSRPLPVNYGEKGITVFYGANDGTFRAVNASNGKERWAFIAPEFFPRLSRLMTDSPLISYPDTKVEGSIPKYYFFDGSTGVYQNGDNQNPVVWVFPTMRRGGRMLYALDVSNPDSPTFKWKAGCPNLDNDSGCTSGMSGIGQTWSTPNIAFIKGHSTETPVLAIGGGYDNCEDADTRSPTCANTKGGFVYILNAGTGALLAAFQTERSVAADVSFVDADGDGYPDYAYAADTGGNLYRVDFVSSNKTVQGSAGWTMRRVAFTNGGYRKFLFAPAVLANKDKVYVAIGTGDREHPLGTQYPFRENVLNRFYVFKDDLASTTTAADLDSLANYTNSTSCSTPAVLPQSELKGWYMDLNQYGTGEQTVTTALIAGGMVTFSTNRPVPKAASCSASLGEARGYWVNLLNASGAVGVTGNCGGTRSSVFVGGGLPPSPVLANSVPINKKNTTVVIGATRRTGSGADISISPQEIKPIISSKRKRAYFHTKEDN
ncbi:pilus assembly protein [Noviherbaspirillum aerium]|uniref:pilus assembly protein n=1 Tax=Noviherbaspirillum aerium TaxID=2588497 RepID=UPI00124C9AAA|nr:PilC/PilY family type IV pilus protein [Noviherbaspirillum aerium]